MDFHGEWTVEDFHDVNRNMIAMMSSVTHQVDVIMDTRDSGRIPKGFMSALRGLRTKSSYPNMRMMISIGNNAFIRSFVNLYLKIYPVQESPFYMAGSDKEVYAILDKVTYSKA